MTKKVRYTFSVTVMKPSWMWFDKNGLTTEPIAPYSTHKYIRTSKKLHGLLRRIFNEYPDAEVHVDRFRPDKKGKRLVWVYTSRKKY